MAAAVALGMSAAQVKSFQKNAPWNRLIDTSSCCCPCECGCFGDICRLWNRFGVAKGDKLLEYLRKTFEKEMGKDITFQELYEWNEVDLKLGVTNLSTKKFEYLCKDTHPNMPISLACRASSAIPFVFVPVQYKGQYYVDGGVLGNLPVRAFPKEPVLEGADYSNDRHVAINLVTKDDGHHAKPWQMKEFIHRVVDTVLHATQDEYGLSAHTTPEINALQREGIDVINIDTQSWGSLDTNMDQKQMEAMWQAGEKAIEHYYRSSSLGCHKAPPK
jgi:predicted acylesterase/phospholipase RssA